MNKIVFSGIIICILATMTGCESPEAPPVVTSEPAVSIQEENEQSAAYPKIASWLAKKDQIIASNKPYSLVMSGWFTPEETAAIKKQNPEALILAGLSINWIWDNPEWISFLLTVAGYGKEKPYEITENMYLKNPDGSRGAFGWKSDVWNHAEIYAMDPRNPQWSELIVSFYRNVLEQPQHDGIIVDMVLEKSLFPESISDQEWVTATKTIMEQIDRLNTRNKPVIFNSGRDFSEIDSYREYMDGYLMENFMGEQLKSTFSEGIEAAGNGYMVIFAADTDDTGVQDLKKMRLGLVLSLLYDNTFFTYDFGPRDHGDAWWFDEYDVELGKPLGDCYREGSAYFREFEKGIVVASPDADSEVEFEAEYSDITSGEKAAFFTVEQGDGRIFLK